MSKNRDSCSCVSEIYSPWLLFSPLSRRFPPSLSCPIIRARSIEPKHTPASIAPALFHNLNADADPASLIVLLGYDSCRLW